MNEWGWLFVLSLIPSAASVGVSFWLDSKDFYSGVFDTPSWAECVTGLVFSGFLFCTCLSALAWMGSLGGFGGTELVYIGTVFAGLGSLFMLWCVVCSVWDMLTKHTRRFFRWLGFFVLSGFLVSCLAAGCSGGGGEASYELGFEDGDIATYRDLCDLRGPFGRRTLIKGDWHDRDYARGYADGTEAGIKKFKEEGCPK